MKKTIMLILAAISLSVAANAQQTLPYSNGFDTQTEISDWVVYREGLTTVNGYTTATWAPVAAVGAASSPNIAYHDYPVEYQGTELTDDWMVLKSLDFSHGAKVALKLWIYAIMGIQPGDTVQLYLFSGNQDPALATKTLLADLTYMAVNTGTTNSPGWKDTTAIIIPPVSGDAYIAFRYSCIADWFTVAIDDIEITADSTAPPPPSGIQNIKSDIAHLEVYPNPATTTISWHFTGHKEQDKLLKGEILDAQGKVLLTFPAMTKQLDIHTLSPGLYYLKIENGMKTFVKK